MGISWTATNNALDDDLHSLLARKDAENQMNMKIAAQFQDQQEAAANQQLRQAQIDAQREARQAAIAQQKASQVSLDDQRKATAEKARAEATAKETSTKEAAAHKSQLEALVADPNADPDMKKAAQWELMGLKYKPNDLTSDTAQQKVFSVDPRSQTMKEIGTAPKSAHFVTQPAPVQPAIQLIQTVDENGNPVFKAVDKHALKNGDVVGPTKPTTAQIAEKDAVAGAHDMIGQIDELTKRINTHKGIMATAAGEAARREAQVNLNDDVAEYEALKKIASLRLVRAVIPGQRLNIQELIAAGQLFPDVHDSQSVRDRKIARMQALFPKTAAPNGRSTTTATKPPTDEGPIIDFDANGNIIKKD